MCIVWSQVGGAMLVILIKKLCCLSVDDGSWALPVRISSGPSLKSVETITGKPSSSRDCHL